MDLAAARPLIQSAFERLRSPGRPPVFDEWAILAMTPAQGGILAYLEHTGNQSGAWQGHCFVFDERGTVNAALAAVPAQCREPIVSVARDQESQGTAPAL